ncbi:MAG: hypothetical protein E6L09_02195 [Verrucomicrobia bacterium]|nr:MAG: hypothetical protein E6L09_02195 [Verrucomicrobiota bacterium]
MSSVIIRFNLPLRNVRLKDVLDAVVKVADKPIEYSVEDYGLVFSAAPNPAAGSGSALRGKALEAAPLQVRTFRVDTNNFLAGLKRAFGTGSELKENATPDQIRSVLVDVFTRLGINMDLPGKTVFYNDLTGIVMVVNRRQDHERLATPREVFERRRLQRQRNNNRPDVKATRPAAKRTKRSECWPLIAWVCGAQDSWASASGSRASHPAIQKGFFMTLCCGHSRKNQASGSKAECSGAPSAHFSTTRLLPPLQFRHYFFTVAWPCAIAAPV